MHYVTAGQRTELMCIGCRHCGSCPAELPVYKLMDSYNAYLNDGSVMAICDRLENHWDFYGAFAKNCTACGRCEALCTQRLPIVSRLRYIASLF